MSSESPSRGGVLKQAFANFREHQMTDHAAALTYYAMMSLFPALLVAVTLLGFFGQKGLVTDATNYLLDHGADEQTAAVVGKALGRIINSSGGALGATLLISILLGINGASGAFGAAGRALNEVYGADDKRSFVARKLTDVGVTLLVVFLLLVVLVSLFLGGQVAHDLLGKIGLGSTGATVWSYVRWPVALVAAMLAFGLVLRLSPAEPARENHWLSLGAVFGVLLWIGLSVAFALYIRGFSSYGAAYGAFGAAIVLLLWLYLSANAFLFGAELNAEARRTGLTEGDAPETPSATPATG